MQAYRALFAREGTRAVAVACALGWLSFGGYGLAIVLAVRAASGSFATAGAAVALFAGASGLLAPWRGRTVDRAGGRALAAFGVVHALALGALAACCFARAPAWALLLSAGLAGACAPPLIATARAVWPRVAGPELARAGHALNAALGDAAGVIAPGAVGAIAALASGPLALAVLVPGPALGALLLARSAPAGARREAADPLGARGWRRALGVLAESPGLRTIVACDLVLGVVFGALDVTAPAVAAGQGSAALGAVPLAAVAAGSVGMSLWSGAHASARGPAARYAAGTVVMAVALAPALAAGHSLAVLTALTLLAGAGYGLLNVAVFELLDIVAGERAAVEALTWLTSLQGAGMAAGAAAAGHLAASPGAALALVAVPPALAAALVLARRATLTRA